MTLEEMLRERARLKALHEEKEAEAAAVKKEMTDVDAAIFARFEAEGIASTKVPGVGNFIMMERMNASVVDERKGDYIERFKRHFPDLVQETINGNTLSAFVRDARKNDRELPPEIEECVKTSVTRYMQQRR